jgi:hypothetical protein
MPRPLILSLDGEEFSVGLFKVDRSALYGDVQIEAFDEKGNPATIKVLAADGNTLIDKGGTALEMVDKDGNSLERNQIQTVDIKGKPLKPVESSFSHVNPLKKAEIDDYLSLIVKSVYWIQPNEGETADVLFDHLKEGHLYSFPFSYRDGIDSDEAYLVGNGTDAFMIIGQQATLQYVKFSQTTTLDSTEEQEISADDIDFDLL